MVGFASELWVASPDSAMTIFATMPSGAPGIHRAREDISLLAYGDGWLSTSSSSSPPTLSTCSSSSSPLATDCIYIATSTGTLRATQWLNPFIPLHAALSFETTCVPSWFGSAQQSPEPAKARPADLGSEPAKARSASPAQKPSPGKEMASASLQYRLWFIGHTWEMIAQRCISPWFNRVDSKSNPVDGLSRGDRQGPWSAVTHTQLPRRLLRALRSHAFP